MPVNAAPDIAGNAPVNLEAAKSFISALTIEPSTIFAEFICKPVIVSVEPLSTKDIKQSELQKDYL